MVDITYDMNELTNEMNEDKTKRGNGSFTRLGEGFHKFRLLSGVSAGVSNNGNMYIRWPAASVDGSGEVSKTNTSLFLTVPAWTPQDLLTAREEQQDLAEGSVTQSKKPRQYWTWETFIEAIGISDEVGLVTRPAYDRDAKSFFDTDSGNPLGREEVDAIDLKRREAALKFAIQTYTSAADGNDPFSTFELIGKLQYKGNTETEKAEDRWGTINRTYSELPKGENLVGTTSQS